MAASLAGHANQEPLLIELQGVLECRLVKACLFWSVNLSDIAILAEIERQLELSYLHPSNESHNGPRGPTGRGA